MTIAVRNKLGIDTIDPQWVERFEHEFNNYTTATEGVTTVAAGSGSTVAQDASAGNPNSSVLVTTQAADNDVQGVRTTQKLYLPVLGKPMSWEVRIKFANQASNNANIVAGFASTTTLTMTNGIDPSASYSGALLYKLDGGTNWCVQVSNGSTKTSVESSTPAPDGTYDLAVSINDAAGQQGLVAEVTFYVNGHLLHYKPSSTTLPSSVPPVPIKLYLTYASLAAAYGVVLAQAGSANAQTMYVDRVLGRQRRFPNPS